MPAGALVHLGVSQPLLLPEQPLANDAEGEPRRIVNLAIEAGGPAEVDILAGVAARPKTRWVRGRSGSGVCEVVLKGLNVRVQRRESREEVVDRGGGQLA